MAKVIYMSKRVSDDNLRQVLERIAVVLDHDIVVKAGDRSRVVNGTVAETSLLRKPAVDFTAHGITLQHVFDTLRRNKTAIFDRGRRYQVILHGRFTDTAQPQIHVERLVSGPALVWFTEGLTRSNTGRYRRVW
jgi:hypothetical protein